MVYKQEIFQVKINIDVTPERDTNKQTTRFLITHSIEYIEPVPPLISEQKTEINSIILKTIQQGIQAIENTKT